MLNGEIPGGANTNSGDTVDDCKLIDVDFKVTKKPVDVGYKMLLEEQVKEEYLEENGRDVN